MTPNSYPQFALESGLGFQLGLAHRLLRDSWEKMIEDLGLSAPQAAMLRIAAGNEGISLREIARRVQTDPMNAKRILDYLETRGLITSTSTEHDRRLRIISATKTGHSLAIQLEDRVAMQDELLQNALTTQGVSALRMLLSELQRALRPQDPVNESSHPISPLQ